MKLVDYHMHSDVTLDANSDIDALVKKAKELGHKKICFTQHYNPKGHIISIEEKRIPKYIKEVKQARKKYNVDVKFGFEFDYYFESEEKIKEIIKKYRPDFCLGSIHSINNRILEWINHRITIPFLHTKSKEEILKVYFNRMEQMIKSGLIDVVAHVDVFRRFMKKSDGKISFEDYKPYAKRIIYLLKKYDVGFEINSSGFWKVGEQYPLKEFIELAYINGIRKVTIGSDTHKLKYFSKDLDKVLDLMKEIGFKKIAVFDQRKVSYIPIKEIEK